MKKILQATVFLVMVLGCLDGVAQKRLFVRLFDEKGKKIWKGIYKSSTDSSISLKHNEKDSIFTISQIHTIKLHRSFGSGVVKGGLIGGGILAVAGMVTADPEATMIGYNAAEGAAAGFLTGAVLGGVIGGIVDATRKRPSFDIRQDPANWKRVRELLEMYKK